MIRTWNLSILWAENSRHWVWSIKKEYENFPFFHDIILKQNYIVILTSCSLANIWQNSILCDSICLYIGSDIAVLYGNGPFSILVLSTKKWNSSFLKTVFVLQKICLKLLKTFKILTDCHIKTYWSLKWRAPLKIPGTVF